MQVNIFSTKKKYQIIYADPPWEYPKSGSKTHSRGMAKQHYPTMPTKDICKLPVHEIATDNAVCFMWATFPQYGEALKVFDAWGFEYKTAAFVWVKENYKSSSLFWGMGAYTRANAEICLLGTSKHTHAKKIVKSHRVHQIIVSHIGKHSKKPNETRGRIVELLGGLPRIELFAREETPGWDTWGNEVGAMEKTKENLSSNFQMTFW